MQPMWIDDAAALEAARAAWAHAPVVALDAEGDGFFRYRARLCTLQIAWDAGIALVDTLAIAREQLACALSALVAESGPRKLIHDAAFDVRLLRDLGLEVGHVLDTSVLARYLGEPATGLASLVSKYLGVTLDKELRQTDWSRRPLDPALLGYLADDVRYLLPLGERLWEEARARGITEEVWEESRYVVSRAMAPPEPPRPAWMRVKGARDLPLEALPVLRELASLREARAEAADVPPFRVMHDRVLVELARRRPSSLGALRRVRMPAPGRGGVAPGDVLEAVARGTAADAIAEDEMRVYLGQPPPAEQRKLERARARALTQWRQRTARARGVDPQVVLPGHCLQDLAREGAADRADLERIAGLGAVRIGRDASAILDSIRRVDEA